MRLSWAQIPPQDQDAALQVLADCALSGVEDPYVRRVALQITQHVPARDELGELNAIYDAVKFGTSAVPGLENGVRYVADPRIFDFYTQPRRLLQLCTEGACGEDCLPSETLVLKRGHHLTPIGDVKEGDYIAGDGTWVRVTKFWDKGVLPTIEIELNNGSVLRCTKGHKLFGVSPAKKGLTTQDRRDDAFEVRAGDVGVGDYLLTGSTLPAGVESMDVDRAWLLGVYVADGWCDNGGHEKLADFRASISGQNGCPKEAQKLRVKEICERLGWPTRWNRKYIAINSKEAAEWMGATGKRAIEKHFPSLNFDAQTVRAMLTGLAADAHQERTRDGRPSSQMFGTISPKLALQVRLMARMLGQSSHIRLVENHGGFGRHPIYRISVRPAADSGIQSQREFARVKAIREAKPTHVVDIEVEGHRFYLPETDLIVHNCDGQAALNAALAACIGFSSGVRMFKPQGAPSFEHVYAVVRENKTSPDPRKVIALDTTVPEGHLGWEPGPGTYKEIWLDDLFHHKQALEQSGRQAG